ncbi:MAG: sigma-54 dependent transcriptional regulator [Prevotellaceae bacterium]|jgi:DNA-binding NtrC family response regulator|nr:sigma-54 dependent transcriptional regulator [Prevotellaceae bacterium]
MKILIVDDERSIRHTLKDILAYENYEVVTSENGRDALKIARSAAFDMVFCDIKMDGMDGLEVLEHLQAAQPDLPVVMISGHGTIDTAVEAIKKGAYDFIEKPLDLNRVLIAVRNATEKTGLVKETKTLKRKITKTPEIIGKSKAIAKVKEMIDRVAPTDARVLITGGNGTGKELAARWLHEKSRRREGAFVEVNCAAIPGELIESELFGHEKGSFTSAVKQHKGKFEQADGGTLFLDEIGDMSQAAQAKVLRVLQENKITRVGGDKDSVVDVRVVAATNKDLQEEIAQGRFREDLYHRLSVIIIHMPSLSGHKEDIPLLADRFITQICHESGIGKPEITPAALEQLQKQPWTGNIREFRNVIERLIILAGKTITDKDVCLYANPNKQQSQTIKQ